MLLFTVKYLLVMTTRWIFAGWSEFWIRLGDVEVLNEASWHEDNDWR